MAYVELDIVSVDGASPPKPLSCRLEEPGGTIGRDPASSLVLTDRHRRVSRQHARIVIDPAGVAIVNESAGLPVMVGSEQLDFRQTARLTDGALLEIGPFVLRATVRAGLLTPSAAPESAWSGKSASPQPDPGRTNSPTAPQPLDVESLFGGPSGLVSSAPPSLGNSADPPKKPTTAEGSARPCTQVSVATTTPAAAVDVFAGINPAPPPVLEPPGSLESFWPAPPPKAATPAPTADLLDLLTPRAFTSAGAIPPDPAFAPSYGQGTSSSPVELIPEDFNPFDLPSADRRNPTNPLSDFDDRSIVGGRPASEGIATEPSIDALFLGPGSFNPESRGADASGSDPLGALFTDRSETDPLAALGVPTGQLNPDQPMPDHAQMLNNSVSIPRPATAAPRIFPESSPPSVATASAFETEPAQLLSAFLHGAGVPASALPQGLTPEVMRQIGIMLHAATAGAIDLLAARAATKREVQASVTIISSQANNPLKFLPSPEAALQQMLGRKIPGFLPGDRAVQDAFDDLRAHEVGVIAGTRAALEEILDRFDPDHLAENLTKGSLLDNLIPSSRKANLWDLFVKRYSDIRREAEDNFHAAFGRAFVEAYEEETRRMRGISPGDPS